MAQCKTKADLHREYARVIDMCEGTNINPWADKCVKYDRSPICENPSFTGKIEKYSFALAIVEGKPVFPGDAVYNKITGEKCIVGSLWKIFDNVSWNPPQPKKLVLNGVELPMPCDDPGYIMWIGFKNMNDAENFKETFFKIINEQR